MSSWFVYMIRAADESLYTGVATDVERRLKEHRDGVRGARYLRGRAPLELVYQCELEEQGLALRVESRLKKLPKADKESLVSSRPDRDGLLETLQITDS